MGLALVLSSPPSAFFPPLFLIRCYFVKLSGCVSKGRLALVVVRTFSASAVFKETQCFIFGLIRYGWQDWQTNPKHICLDVSPKDFIGLTSK